MEGTYNIKNGRKCGSRFAKRNECDLCSHCFQVDRQLFCRHEKCITVKILDQKEIAEKQCKHCHGFAGMKGPKGDCWGYCKYEKCIYVRAIPEGMFHSHQCKLCLSFVGYKDGQTYCQKRFCDNVDDEYMKYVQERQKQSECYKCPYANPKKPCVGFCLKRMLKGVEQ